MKNWIPLKTSLEGNTVKLLPLHQNYFAELIKISSDVRIWKHYVFEGENPEIFHKTLISAMDKRKKGEQFPFVIYHKQEKRIIGSTRFMDIWPHHRNLEIGFTWLHPDYWGTHINLECKILLLTYCFEELKTVRVQLKTDADNKRSRKAIEKIGGKFEGLIRNQMIRSDGTIRTSAMYSIVPEEWKELKSQLVSDYEKLIS